MEKWKKLSFEGLNDYQVSNTGNVRRILPNGSFRMRNSKYRKKGYVVIRIRDKNYRVHRLVAMAFVEGRSDLRNEVNHINGIKDDNRSENLSWVTSYENSDHSMEVLKKGCISIPVICFNHVGEKIAEFQSKSLARKWGFKPSQMMESSIYSNVLALERINRPRKKHEYKKERNNISFLDNFNEVLKQNILFDIKNGMLIKDVSIKHKISRYKIDLIIKSAK